MSPVMSDPTRPAHRQYCVDNTDWLKTAAIILVVVDHIGYFFIENADWWSVLGRLAAPVFFFLLGYAQTRTVPLYWIWLGVILTLLDSWNTDWTWVAPNILLSFALIRIARPYVKNLIQNHGWVAFALLVAALLALLPIAGNVVEYGAEGWLWALFGVYQRLYVVSRSTTGGVGTSQSATPQWQALFAHVGQMRLLICFITAIVYVWQEQREFAFSQIQLAVFIVGIVVLSLGLCGFQRGPGRIQVPEFLAGALRFIGRHTLEIYAIQLAGSELIIGLLPDLAP